MAQRRRKRAATVVAVILAALIILSAVTGGVLTFWADGAITQRDLDKQKEDIKNQKEALNSLKNEKKDLQSEFGRAKANQADVITLKAQYDSQIENLEGEIAASNELLTSYTVILAEYQRELDAATAKEKELRDQYAERIRAMEGMGDVSYLSILLQSESLTDLLTRWDAVNEIMTRDKNLADELLETSKQILADKEQMERDKNDQESLRQELAVSQSELAQLSREADEMMNAYTLEMARVQGEVAETDADIKKQQEAIDAAEKELKEQQAEFDRIQEELRRNKNPYVGGAYLWPVPGCYNISSPFGNRFHPVYKVMKFHNGIDIAPTPKGTPIIAANSGTIIIRKKSSSYGNYVVIDHGGNQATLYAHMSGFAKGQAVGSEVTAGDVIGYIGSTGISTGNHLHFEIHKGGKPVNPMTGGLLQQ
ncbi:MAG: peptidoglycan DD-metalloendopeptidase family protein [Oscillospiraceae bacterium]|jgi:murein DD-endopeptidase MepM/ murein hydrolase activator NlpD|nr:peptidoglycan DD-metalloendopeptidase family protein [Oscillospiraceae bacterium]